MKYLVHCSNPNLGGAERSVVEEFSRKEKTGALFVLPYEGPLCELLQQRCIPYKILLWPPGVHLFTQGKLNKQLFYLTLFPLFIIPWLKYLYQLNKITKQSTILYSSGIKSHCICIGLSLVFSPKIILNIRDFIDPPWFRKLLSRICALQGIQIEANSKAVGEDYFQAKIKYPIVKMGHSSVQPNKKGATLIISHLAYFAPYKGQLLFLNYARKILDQGVSARFWMIGDVIYPGKSYMEYRERIDKKITELKLDDAVKRFGQVEDPSELLSQTNYLLHCTTQPEPFGRVILEALQKGCDVICHKGNGCLELLENISDVSISPFKGIVDAEAYCLLESGKVKVSYPENQILQSRER